jgi:hypothetical protein
MTEKGLLFLKGTIYGHKIYIVPKRVKVTFSISALPVPELLPLPSGDCRNPRIRSEDMVPKKKKSLRRQ